MTAPEWVRAALVIEGLGVGEPPLQTERRGNDETLVSKNRSNLQPSDGTDDYSSSVESEEETSSLWYTITSKEDELVRPYLKHRRRAVTTCDECPNPYVNQRYSVAPTCSETGTGHTTVNCTCHIRTEYTARCKKCNTIITRRMRAKRLLQDIRLVQDFTGLRVRWVTLTAPNYTDVTEGLADFKKKVKRFRERAAFQSKVIGQVEFYEWTTSSDGTYNVHLHALWIGDYWKQSDLLADWGEGGARIEDASTHSRKCLNYVISYAKKQASQGIRTQQRGGCLYGRAFAGLKSAATLAAASDDVDGAPEEQERRG
mgnify:CR=1 FL=1